MDSPETLALKAAISSANNWNEVAAWCSVLGGVIGLAALLIFRRRIPFAEKAMLIAAGVFVLLGGGGRLVFGARASTAAAQLQQLSGQRVASLKRDQERDHKIAMQAASHAADLGVTVDTLQDFVTKKEEAADAQFAKFKRFAQNERKRNDAVIAELRRNSSNLDKARSDALAAAVDAKRAAAKVEATADKFVPRRLTPDQQKLIADQLKKWAIVPGEAPLPGGGHLGGKQAGYAGGYPDTSETNDLAADLRKAFALAGWDACCEPIMTGGTTVMTGDVPVPALTGISVLATKSPRTDKIADAVVAALRSVGLQARKLPTKADPGLGCDKDPRYFEQLPGCSWVSVIVGDHP